MAAVLKGKKREDIRVILELEQPPARHRRFGVPYWNHQEEIGHVIEWLRNENYQYDEPLVWVERMLQQSPQERPFARELRDDIFRAGRTYSGICYFNNRLR